MGDEISGTSQTTATTTGTGASGAPEGADISAFGLFGDGPTQSAETAQQTQTSAAPQQSVPPEQAQQAQQTAATPAQVQQPATPQSPATPQVPQLPQAVTLTPEQLREFAQTVAQPAQSRQQPIAQPTPEEIDQHFGVVRATQEQIETIFRGGEAGLKTMNDLLHGSAKMGATIATRHLLGEMSKLQQWVQTQFAPARQLAEQTQMQQHTQQFFTKHPQFKPEHTPVLKSVYESLLARQFKGTPEQVYAKIAEEATALIRTVNPQFGAAPAGQPGAQPAAGQPQGQPQQQVQQQPTHQMTTLSMGGGSGAVSPGSAGRKTQAEELFGHM